MCVCMHACVYMHGAPPNTMAEGGEGREQRQLQIHSNIQLPMMNWKAKNPGASFEIFEERLTLLLEAMNIPKDQWFMYILQQTGDEHAVEQKTVLKEGVHANPDSDSGLLGPFRRRIKYNYWFKW